MDEETKSTLQSRASAADGQNNNDIDLDAVSGIQLTLDKIENELQRIKLELSKAGLTTGRSPDFSSKLKIYPKKLVRMKKLLKECLMVNK